MTSIVWSKDGCAFCEQAKHLLTHHGLAFEERKIGQCWSKDDLIKAVPNARTVPQIFINGELVGGYNELKLYLQDQNATQHTS